MTNEEALAIVTRHLAHFSGCEQSAISPTTHLVNDLAIESIDAVELLIAVEREIGTRLEEEMFADVTTAGDLAGRLQEAAAARTGIGAE